jgi:hypothetical protein
VFSEFRAFGLLECYAALFGSWLPEILWSFSVFVELVSNADVILFSGNFKKDWSTTFFNGIETPNFCLLYGYNVLLCQTSKRVVD